MLFPYFELGASLFILILAFQIWVFHYGNKLARFYSMFALVAFFAAILTYSLRIAFTLELARDINRLSATLLALAFAMYFHFVLLFTKKERFLRSAVNRAIIYLPPVVLGLLFLFTNLMYQRYEIVSIGIVSQPAPLYSLFAFETFAFCMLGIVLLLQYARTTPQKTEKTQAILIAIGSTIPLVVGLLADQVIPLVYGHRLTPPTVIFDLAAMNFFIFIAMRNYSLFSISAALAADTIMETMPDPLVVTDLAGRVIFLNELAQKFFHVPECDIAGCHIKDLFKDKDHFFKIYSEVVDHKRIVERFKSDLVTPLGEHIPSLINARLLREKLLGEKLGIVFILRDIRG